MRKKVLAAVGLLTLLLAVALVLASLWPHPPGVTPANFRRLNARMTEEQIIALMGRPPDHVVKLPPRHYDQWEGDGCRITVWVIDYTGSIRLPSSEGASGVFFFQAGVEEASLTYPDGSTVKVPEEVGTGDWLSRFIRR
jgi:hypothetical protein